MKQIQVKISTGFADETEFCAEVESFALSFWLKIKVRSKILFPTKMKVKAGVFSIT
jgi:hypothetical protein